MAVHKMQPQKEDNYCICAVLKEILYKNDIIMSQDNIAKSLNKSEKGFYVDDYKINNLMGVVELDYKYYFHNQTPFNEPDMLLKEMNNNSGFVGINKHVYLLKEFNDPKVILIDPLDLSEKNINIYDLMRDMKNGKGFFGLIKKLK